MSKRINIMINEAIRERVVRRRRRDAVREMDALRTQLPKVSTDEVARWIRDDRERGALTPAPLVVPDASILLKLGPPVGQ